MSLTSFLEDNADVTQRFRQEYTRPKFSAKNFMVAPPLTKNFSTVATAFDYLLRFVLQHLNPNAIDRSHWIAEGAVKRLAENAELHAKGAKIVSRAKKDLADYLKQGQMSDALIESALLLATLDPIARSRRGQEMIGVIHKDDLQDLRNLLSAVDLKVFIAKDLCMLNPSFGSASKLVGGADADLILDDTIIDIKTTKNLILEKFYIDQILGYFVLHNIKCIDEMNRKSAITKVAIYFSRFAYLHVMPISELVNAETFPGFVQWFRERASEAFPK